MKFLFYLLVGSLLIAASCATANKKIKGSSNLNSESNIPGTTVRRTLVPATPVREVKEKPVGEVKEKPVSEVKGKPVSELTEKPIREVEERLITDQGKAGDNNKYFVIIGSFKNFSNALKQQRILRAKGFTSEVLKNVAGLYRVSVRATENIDEAHSEIRRIWAQFPEYPDTWMLVLIK